MKINYKTLISPVTFGPVNRAAFAANRKHILIHTIDAVLLHFESIRSSVTSSHLTFELGKRANTRRIWVAYWCTKLRNRTMTIMDRPRNMTARQLNRHASRRMAALL